MLARAYPSAKPVFIVGMPRSGTSLAEQILASHPKVFGAGELNDFAREAAKLAQGAGDGSLPPISLPLSKPGAFAHSGRPISHGSSRARRRRTSSSIRCHPISVFSAHLSCDAERARHPHAARSDRYMPVLLFQALLRQLPWSYDLAELGRYYRAYEALMAHWRTALPKDFMIEVRYEDLVADLEGQTRRMLAHIGLDWDPRCLDFHETERTVRTASAAQVRSRSIAPRSSAGGPMRRASSRCWRSSAPQPPFSASARPGY